MATDGAVREPATINCVEDILLKFDRTGGPQARRWALYRGLRCFGYTLTPTLFRLDPTKCSLRGVPSIGGMPWDRIESELLTEFKHEAISYFRTPIVTEIELRMLAQHYGLPTRLLDWSKNPLVALYFACECENDNRDAAFVVCSQTFATVPDPTTTTWEQLRHFNYAAVSPPRFDARLIAQSGWFTTHALPAGTEPFVPVDQAIDGLFLPEKRRIPADRKGPIKLQLEFLGVDHSTIYPGLDGIGRNLKWASEVRHKSAHPLNIAGT